MGNCICSSCLCESKGKANAVETPQKHLSEQKRWKLQAEDAEPRQKENKSRGLKDPEGAKKRREAASKVTVEVG